MNAITSLESMGLTLGLSSDGNLILDGLKRLGREQKARAVALAREHKPAIVTGIKERLALDATHTLTSPEAIAYRLRLMVDCPNTAPIKKHCWYCSQCAKAAGCGAWRHLAWEVGWYRGQPVSANPGEVVQ